MNLLCGDVMRLNTELFEILMNRKKLHLDVITKMLVFFYGELQWVMFYC